MTESADTPDTEQQIRAEIIALIDRARNRYRHDRDYLASLDALRDLTDRHYSTGGVCADCGQSWPCTTIRRLRQPDTFIRR